MSVCRCKLCDDLEALQEPDGLFPAGAPAYALSGRADYGGAGNDLLPVVREAIDWGDGALALT